MIKAFLSRFGIDAASRAIILSINILIARKLSVSDYGLFSYALSLANLLYIFTEMGVHTHLLKEVGRNPEKFSQSASAAFLLKLILSGAVICASALLLPYIWPWKYPLIFMGAILWMLGNSLVDLYQTFCNALHRFDIAGKLVLSSRVLLISSAALLFVFNKVSLTSIISVYCAGAIAGAFFASMVFTDSTGIKLRFSNNNIYELFVKSLPIGIAGIFNVAYLRMDTIFLTMIKGSVDTGIYGAAYRFFELAYVLPNILMVVAMPLLARAKQNGGNEAVKNILLKTIIISGVLSLVWIFIAFFNANSLIHFLFGDRYIAATKTLRILAIANVIAFFAQIASYTVLIYEKQKRHALNQAICFVVSFLLNIIFIYKWGAEGAATAVLFTQVSIFLLTLPVLFGAMKKHENRN